jgi:hypothetical protein
LRTSAGERPDACPTTAHEKPLDKIPYLRHTNVMKLGRLIALGALLTLLVTAGTPASAEEIKLNALQTALSSNTISGYVDTSVEWSLGDGDNVTPATPSHGFGRWWQSFRIWLWAHRWR